MISYETLKKTTKNNSYSPKRALQLILLLRKGKQHHNYQDKIKTELFFMMSGVIVKNIESFNFLFRPYQKSSNQLFEQSELISESYFAFDACLTGFCAVRDTTKAKATHLEIDGCRVYNYNNPKNFYFYFNKSLKFRFKRYIEKYLKKHNQNQTVEVVEDWQMNVKSFNEADFLTFDATLVGLNDEQIIVLQSRFDGQTHADFLKQYKNWNLTKYNFVLNQIQQSFSQWI